MLSSTAEVYWWDDTGMEGRVRTLLPHGEANRVWGAYSDVQRIYNGFTNEWDICTDFGDNPMGIDSDGDLTEDEIPYDEGPINNKDSMDVGLPSSPSALQRKAADSTPMAIESPLAVRFKATNQDPIAIENSMDIGPPSACSSLQLGAIDQHPKAAESPSMPSVPPLETASQDLTTIENPMDTETPSAPINQDLTTDRPAPTAVESSSPSPVLHLEPLPEKSPALPPAGPSGISPARVHEPEWVEKVASHGCTLYEHEIAQKIKRLLPPSSPLSHTPASVPMSTPAQHQWIDTLSADYGHPVEST